MIGALERFANADGMLSEQLWDADDLPAAPMKRGDPPARRCHCAGPTVTQSPSGAPIEFTFFWTDAQRWEGRNFTVTIREEPRAGSAP